MHDSSAALSGTLALFAATVAVLFGVALTRDDDAPTSLDAASAAPAAVLDSDELLELSLERMPAVARRVEAIRGLEFDEVPEPQVTDSEGLRDLAEDQLAKPKVAKQIAAADAELKLLGMLDSEDSLADVATEVTADAAAYYDPKEKELFLLGDAVPAGAAVTEFILAHELNHALEDQAFGLPKSEASSDDSVLAESALVEGTATALMMEYAAKHLELGDLIDESSSLENDSGDLPEIALAQVRFSYFGGQSFVDALRATAEGGWDLVDFAYQRRVPETTEQILHPEKYLEDEGPLSVPAVPGPGRGWERMDAGAVGEFFTRELLRQDAEEVGADEAAAGWGGDHYAFFHRAGTPAECESDCREDNAMTTIWRGDDVAETRELDTAIRDYVERSLGGEPSAKDSWELEGGWAAVGGTGDLVTLAFAPDEGMALQMAELSSD